MQAHTILIKGLEPPKVFESLGSVEITSLRYQEMSVPTRH